MDNFDLSTFLPYQLAHLSERVSKRLSVIYENEFGLGLAEWRVLVHVARAGSVSVRDIHNCVNLEKSRVSRAVTRMQNDGLVKKTENQDDHRLVGIALTNRGKSIYQDLIPKVVAVEAQLLGALKKSEREALTRCFETLHGILDADPHAKPRACKNNAPGNSGGKP